jgi:hypothetical protein
MCGRFTLIAGGEQVAGQGAQHQEDPLAGGGGGAHGALSLSSA